MNLLTRKLEGFGMLDASDRELLDEMVKNVRHVASGTTIIHEGEAPSDVRLVLEGFACRNKVTSVGDRQILAFLIPGDFCDLHVALLGEMDHSITTLSDCKIVQIPFQSVEAMTSRPRLARALWWATLVDEGTLREWIVNLGTRDAKQKVTHLFCELLIRLRAVGLADSDEYRLPITQADLADTVGLSAIHVNRVLQGLRADGLIDFEGKTLTIHNLQKLVEISGFNPNYLHLADQGMAVTRNHTKVE